MDTPVLFLIFNRPEFTARVFNRIRRVKPRYFFVAADGPRSTHPNDLSLCAQTREIATKIDWPCEVRTLFRDHNLGCGTAVSEALNWFFGQVDRGIVLEDDVLPELSFFGFCSELLDYYEANERIMHISGSNIIGKPPGVDSGYYFSNFPLIWGWASWRRAWKNYDFNMKALDSLDAVREDIKTMIPFTLMDQVRSGAVDTWDIQWVYSVLIHRGMVINPVVNLVRNIGLLSGTHMSSQVPVYYMDLKYGPLPGLKHPGKMVADNQADLKQWQKLTRELPFYERYYRRLRYLFENLLRKTDYG